MTNVINEYNETTKERRELIRERIEGIAKETALPSSYGKYFTFVASFLQKLFALQDEIEQGTYRSKSLEELATQNKSLYDDICSDHYETSYANPTVTVKAFGKDEGQIFAFLYHEICAAMLRIFEGRFFDLCILAELFVQVENLYEDYFRDNQSLEAAKQAEEEKKDPAYFTLLTELKEIIYYYAYDYSEIFLELRALELFDPTYDFAYDIIMHSNLSDLRYLYFYGEFITDNEIGIANFLNKLPEEEVKAMADTYTDGYVRGFVTMESDFSKKSTVVLRYPIGFERMMRFAIKNFEKMGKKVTIFRAPSDVINKTPGHRPGYTATQANPQLDYDHRFDNALFMDNKFKNHRFECQKNAWEAYKTQMAEYAGPAVVETFGEPDFEPTNKKEACRLDASQEALVTALRNETGNLSEHYIKDEETSYTIIAYPLPSIGENFADIFSETVRLNNLDNDTYQKIHQKIIDVLDRGDAVIVKGMGENKTDLLVSLMPMTDPDKQTRFENCTADVNIPVGEVFTSPRLTDTNGLLHVTKVFLDGLEYKNLSIRFENGMIAEYQCSNFEKPEENQSFIKENILNNQETLPIGEFAIGTNTKAYRMGRMFDIQRKLPILIAEKTGPHFAVGDTCYSRSEDHAVFNPDGKEIIARDNECSLLRKTDPGKAYFNCHTDITIPYDEVGLIAAVQADGTLIPIIKDGKFVLAGTESLNEDLIG